jgi:hypothetical protein
VQRAASSNMVSAFPVVEERLSTVTVIVCRTKPNVKHWCYSISQPVKFKLLGTGTKSKEGNTRWFVLHSDSLSLNSSGPTVMGVRMQL